MNERLFIFLAQASAAITTRFRTGARHALMLYASGPDIVLARSKAVDGANGRGWTYIEVWREKEISSDTSAITDHVLRAAADDALRTGHSMVVYPDELPLNS